MKGPAEDASATAPFADRCLLGALAMPAVMIAAFVAGTVAGHHIPAIARWPDHLIDGLQRGYGKLAPFVIFFSLAPLLARARRARRGASTIRSVVGRLALKRLAACLFSVVFTWIVFDLPVWPAHVVGARAIAERTEDALVAAALGSPYTLVACASVAVSLVAVRIPKLAAVLERAAEGIERLGEILEYATPALMFCVGAYLCGLPRRLADQLHHEPIAHASLDLRVGHVELGSSGGMVLAYLLVSVLVGAACLLFHAGTLVRVKRLIPGFSLRTYFLRYWLKAYPFLWASSNEVLGVSLNLSLVRRLYPAVPRDLRLFVLGVGSWLNITGTQICVFVMAGGAARIVGYSPSLLELTLAVPVAFLLSYAVPPGVPGDLILFAGPMASVLSVPAELVAPFTAIYIGFNFGLPESFRTGQNSTDNCLIALQLTALEGARRRPGA
jgi:Na+/H+-dicarboxylate symporter